MRTFRSIAVLAVAVTLFGCGKEVLPTKPQLVLDRESIGFGAEFGSGVFIGTTRTETLQIQNGGLEDMTLSAEFMGDAEFKIEGPLKTTLKGKERTFIRVEVSPKAEKIYMGTLTITSNAENAPKKVVPVSAKAFKAPPPDGG